MFFICHITIQVIKPEEFQFWNISPKGNATGDGESPQYFQPSPAFDTLDHSILLRRLERVEII